jgi:Na+-transporting methylmalonyl-CoA/oxaloacetate decarboxylase gamma subunit
MLNFELFTEVLPILAKGYGGVFAVTVVIVFAVKILSSLTKKK